RRSKASTCAAHPPGTAAASTGRPAISRRTRSPTTLTSTGRGRGYRLRSGASEAAPVELNLIPRSATPFGSADAASLVIACNDVDRGRDNRAARARRSGEQEVAFVQGTRRHVLQRDGVAGAEADHGIGVDLVHRRLNGLEVAKHAVELHAVTVSEIGDH